MGFLKQLSPRVRNRAVWQVWASDAKSFMYGSSGPAWELLNPVPGEPLPVDRTRDM